MTERCYFVFDSRAEYDEDVACVLEAINEDEYKTEEEVKAYCKRAWGDMHSVLKSYEVKGNNAINGKRVYFE